MPEWLPLPDAPRADAEGKPVPVRLFLPSAKYDTDSQGRPFNIEHLECVGIWDAAQQHWVDQATGRKAYPSQWRPLQG